MRNLFLALFLILLTPCVFAKEGKLNIVTTQTLFADLVQEIGKDKVNVSAVASPKYNIHFIQPRPSDVRKVAKADLYVNAGLDLEAWSDPLLEAAGKPSLFRNAEDNVDLSYGLGLLNMPDHPLNRAEGDIHAFGNPHFQMNPENARRMAQTILEKLKQKDPANSSYYEENTKAFLAKLDSKISEWKAMCASIQGKEIISYHEDIAYLADFLRIKAEQFLEPKPGIPPTPKHMEFLKEYAKANHITAIVMPSYYPANEAKILAQNIGGEVVIIAQEPGEVPGTEGFFDFFDYNFKHISQGVK